MSASSTGKQTALKNVLDQIVTEGDYEAALLSDSDGLPLATFGASATAGMMAAMAALLGDAARQARRQLDLSHVDELSLVGEDRFRLVCRFFETAQGQALCLTVVVPPDQAYRRITNQAIKKIKTVWTR
jgi:predicted regulator of Ras-like GTPase activity (Roadblock/LC7/MglB family)